MRQPYLSVRSRRPLLVAGGSDDRESRRPPRHAKGHSRTGFLSNQAGDLLLLPSSLRGPRLALRVGATTPPGPSHRTRECARHKLVKTDALAGGVTNEVCVEAGRDPYQKASTEVLGV